MPQNTPPSDAESRVIADFCRQFRLDFKRPDLLKLALTHRSYLSVTGQSARESNERLEFLGDSVLGLVTSEFLYREHPGEHEGQLTKTKSLLVSKAILSRRALAMGIGKYVLMSRSESDSGGRQRLSILADAFESILGAIYLDQGFEVARQFIMTYLLRDSREIVADKRHTNYKSHLQEYVQSTYRTHPVYRIRSEVGPDHSKQFNVEVVVGRRVLGTGRGHNKKDAEQAAARDALARAEGGPRSDASRREEEPARPARESRESREVHEPRRDADDADEGGEGRRRGRRGGRTRREREPEATDAPPRPPAAPAAEPDRPPPPRRVLDPASIRRIDAESDEEGRPEGLLEARRVDPYAWDTTPEPPPPSRGGVGGRTVDRVRGWDPDAERERALRDAGRRESPSRDATPPAPPPESRPDPEPAVVEQPAWEPAADVPPLRDDARVPQSSSGESRSEAPREAEAYDDDVRDDDVHVEDVHEDAARHTGDAGEPPDAAPPPAPPAYGRRRARR